MDFVKALSILKKETSNQIIKPEEVDIKEDLPNS